MNLDEKQLERADYLRTERKDRQMEEAYERSRYSAPPDDLPDEKTYCAETVAEYVKSCFPEVNPCHGYSIEEVKEYLKIAIAMLDDEEHGIDTFDK